MRIPFNKQPLIWFTILLSVFLLLAACEPSPNPTPLPPVGGTVSATAGAATVTPSPEPTALPSLLVICTGPEPSALLAWLDDSQSARNIRAALENPLVSYQGFQPQAGLLQAIPSQDNGMLRFDAVEVRSGEILVNAEGQIQKLEGEVSYYPSGCRSGDCLQLYQGEESVTVDQMVVEFALQSGLSWSDGEPLTAGDSVYAYELARAVYPRLAPERVRYTDSYFALDASRLEWRGVPGFIADDYLGYAFQPLPEHAWVSFSVDELANVPGARNNQPGTGPFRIVNWVSGDHIELERNPYYLTSSGATPAVERLVYRFIADGDEAVAALQVGECDLVAPGVLSPENASQLQASGSYRVLSAAAGAWEQITFGISSLTSESPSAGASPLDSGLSLAARPEVRLAIAQCLDRAALAESAYGSSGLLTDTFVHPAHPAYLVEAGINFDPAAGIQTLETAGWRDLDGDPATPRQAQGIADLPAGASLELSYLTLDTPQRRAWAESIRQGLAGCGISLQPEYFPAEELFLAGQEGRLFGRRFEIAQFGWEPAVQPPCWLYKSDEIPGPYPQYPRGWGGANLSGYRNADYDRACATAQRSLAGEAAYLQAHLAAQEIFVTDLPALPLFIQPIFVAARPEVCGVQFGAGSLPWFQNLAGLYLGDGC